MDISRYPRVRELAKWVLPLGFQAAIVRLLSRSMSGKPPARPGLEADAYLSWLSFANAGMLSPGNILCFDHAIKNLPSDNPVVEIGSFCGLSTNVIGYCLGKHDRPNKFFTCDKWLFEGADRSGFLGHSHITHTEYREFVKSTYVRNVVFFLGARKPFTIEELSDDFFRLWSHDAVVKDVFGRQISLGGNISFCYIDGNHQYEFVKHDFQNTDRYLDKGGFILFDDSSDFGGFSGVRALMKEIRKSGRYQVVMKNPNYLFRKILL